MKKRDRACPQEDDNGTEYIPRASTSTDGKKKRPLRRGDRAAALPPSANRSFGIRLFAIMALFLLVCCAYAVRLITLQAEGNAYAVFISDDTSVGVSTTTVTLQAPRGGIYDRNGTPLVTNFTSYSVSLDHDGFYSIGGLAQRNRTLLTVLAALDASFASAPDSGMKRAEEMFPFSGAYPLLRYTEEAVTEGLPVAYHLSRTLAFLGLDADTTASELVQYYIRTYDLDAHVDGVSMYTDREIDRLIHLYYNMDRCRFSSLQPYTLVTGATDSLIELFLMQNIPGMQFEATLSRLYHYPGYASHLLGEASMLMISGEREYCNDFGYRVNALMGQSGCESAFESLLCGTDGEMTLTLDAVGRIVERNVTKQPIPGKDVFLTIDIGAQIAAEDALRTGIATVANGGSAGNGADCDAGAVVALDPDTGAVIALASYPTFDLSRLDRFSLETNDSQPLLNRALSSAYVPDALYMLCTATAGLDMSDIEPTELLEDPGEYAAAVCPLHRLYGKSHGKLNVITALQDGCEVFFAQLGEKIGIKILNYYGEDMGLGQRSGIELAESAGILAGPAHRQSAGLPSWQDGMLSSAAIGRSDNAATPMQLSVMLTTLLNGGKRYQAHLFSEARSYISGTVLSQYHPKILSDMDLTDGVAPLLLQAMEDKAATNVLLQSRTQEVRATGVRIGFLGAQSFSSTVNSDHALSLTFGQHPDGKAISVCVVLEHGADTNLTVSTAAAVINEYFK